MARSAGRLADLTVVTSDNPRTESLRIDPRRDHGRSSSWRGAPPHRRPSRRNRRDPGPARPGDTVLLAGKGHETYQVVGRVPPVRREGDRRGADGREGERRRGTVRWTDRAVRTALGLPGPYGDVEYSGIPPIPAIPAGSLFVALKGERFDAHDFLESAAAAEWRAPWCAAARRGFPGWCSIRWTTPSTRWASRAHACRKAMSGPVIAITGTNGKTSTKEMIAAALRTRYRVAATRINLNNLVVACRSPTSRRRRTPRRWCWLEPTSRGDGPAPRGHRAQYRRDHQRRAGHLEGFGSSEGVLTEKSLLDGVPSRSSARSRHPSGWPGKGPGR